MVDELEHPEDDPFRDFDITLDRVSMLADETGWYFDCEHGGIKIPDTFDIADILFRLAEELNDKQNVPFSRLGRLFLFREPGMVNHFRVGFEIGVFPTQFIREETECGES